MDRNVEHGYIIGLVNGRTPQECVDRNNTALPLSIVLPSRTPQECVDRNRIAPEVRRLWSMSHSTGVRG